MLTENRGFFVGLALAAPFLATFVPWLVGAALFVPLLFALVTNPPRSLPPAIPLFVWLIVALWVITAAALLTSTTPYEATVWKELAVAGALFAIAVVGAVGADTQKLIDGFFAGLVSIASATALVGLAKLGLQDRGFLLGPIIAMCPDQYPQGASLCADYNLTAMTWLAGAIAVLATAVRSRRPILLLLLPLILAAGFLAGSRRFLILVMALPILWLTLEWVEDKALWLSALARMVIVGMATLLVVSVVSAPESSVRFGFGDEPMTVLLPVGVGETRPPNRAYADVILGTINADSAAARTERFAFGIALIGETPLLGRGFAYHEAFSCKFSACRHIDYPHSNFISAWLMAGVIGAALVLAAYGSIAVVGLRQAPFAAGLTAIVAVVSVYALISGDNIFSVPQWLAVCLVLSVTQRRPATRRVPVRA